jgi:D-glycero-D-manno-heptose 1,7-bisphosphate phosphatase
MTLRPAVFLDRDGTFNEDVGYLDRVERLRLFPWSIDAVRLLNRAGFAVAMVTNQAGIARGMLTEAVVRELHDHIDSEVRAAGARIDGWYYCPHHPDGSVAEYRVSCECRKPEPGMLRRAAGDLALDLARSYVVGDRWLDIRLGHAVGAHGVMVRTGYGATEERVAPPDGVRASTVVDNLIQAVGWILRHHRARQASA